ncbi:HD domain-containing phosphohydrolase [Gemmatimonas sp.]|uniref:HD-GYP domain-containing protein n=1 Tax=Gemmatimonas sp. TaxID=1962908 RepID=UPI00261975F0|nr:HD domain-containing phosphohydrolase [Gemmatimonas sp.]
MRRLIGLYPHGHPLVEERLRVLHEAIRAQLRRESPVSIDIVEGGITVDRESGPLELETGGQVIDDLLALGVQSIQLDVGVNHEELRALAQLLWDMQHHPIEGTVAAQLADRGIRHVRLSRLVPLDTRQVVPDWPDAPSGVLDPDYAESIMMSKATFDEFSSGGEITASTVRDFVQLLMYKVSRSNAVLSQILAVKKYENQTWLHSVNVAMLSLLLGRQVGLRDELLGALVEAALLHDIGKTHVPLDILRKPGALDDRERRLVERHPAHGAEFLLRTPGLHPLTPRLALEHHRTVRGTGYPDLGDGVIPHPMSQLLSVVDIYEAVTGVRTYRRPAPPEQACLLLARLAGDTLNTSLVKTFVNAITFFPLGSLVRTSDERLGVVVRITEGDLLHPVIVPVNDRFERVGDEIDTSSRDGRGAYRVHIVESVAPPDETFDVAAYLTDRAA